MAKNYEIEIKSLLGSKENAMELKNNLHKNFPDIRLITKGKQLNHYFILPNNLDALIKSVEEIVDKNKKEELDHILSHGQKISLRTRDSDGKVILVIKASIGDDTSANGVKRVEFECIVKKSLNELDQVLINSGCKYQAKWSREREEFETGDMHVCIDRNAGYGYLAEFEKVIQDESKTDEVKKSLLDFMDKLGVQELNQERLERMFSYYNSNWQDYYGTEKIFNIN